MFWETLGQSVAKAIFWLLIIGGIGLMVRFLIKDVIKYLTEETDKDNKDNEE